MHTVKLYLGAQSSRYKEREKDMDGGMEFRKPNTFLGRLDSPWRANGPLHARSCRESQKTVKLNIHSGFTAFA